MEFAYANFISTTTSFTVESNTTTAENIINRDTAQQYSSSGFNDDATTTSIVFSFSATTTISRIGILSHNLKEFDIFYNGATASTFTISGATTTSTFASNSATSLYMTATPVACTSVTIDCKSTIAANSEKAIGYAFLSDEVMDFDRIPNASSYKPVITPKQIVHKLSDGGTRIHNVSEKWAVQISYKYIESEFRDELKSVYDLKTPVAFIPFPTTSGWDGIFFECVWPGSFEFYRYTTDAVNSGYSGKIKLMETPY